MEERDRKIGTRWAEMERALLSQRTLMEEQEAKLGRQQVDLSRRHEEQLTTVMKVLIDLQARADRAEALQLSMMQKLGMVEPAAPMPAPQVQARAQSPTGEYGATPADAASTTPKKTWAEQCEESEVEGPSVTSMDTGRSTKRPVEEQNSPRRRKSRAGAQRADSVEGVDTPEELS